MSTDLPKGPEKPTSYSPEDFIISPETFANIIVQVENALRQYGNWYLSQGGSQEELNKLEAHIQNSLVANPRLLNYFEIATNEVGFQPQYAGCFDGSFVFIDNRQFRREASHRSAHVANVNARKIGLELFSLEIAEAFRNHLNLSVQPLSAAEWVTTKDGNGLLVQGRLASPAYNIKDHVNLYGSIKTRYMFKVPAVYSIAEPKNIANPPNTSPVIETKRTEVESATKAIQTQTATSLEIARAEDLTPERRQIFDKILFRLADKKTPSLCFVHESSLVARTLLANPDSLDILARMEQSGGMPTYTGRVGNKLYFDEVRKKLPDSRRNVDYHTATSKAAEIGAPLISRSRYLHLQKKLDLRMDNLNHWVWIYSELSGDNPIVQVGYYDGRKGIVRTTNPDFFNEQGGYRCSLEVEIPEEIDTDPFRKSA